MEPTSAVVVLWPPQLCPFHPGVMPGVSNNEGLVLPWAAQGLPRHPAPGFQLSLLGDCSKKEAPYLKVGRPMGHIIEIQFLNGLILPYCEITDQHIFPNQASTQWEKDEVPSSDVLLSVGQAQCEGAWMWVVGALWVQCVCGRDPIFQVNGCCCLS